MSVTRSGSIGRLLIRGPFARSVPLLLTSLMVLAGAGAAGGQCLADPDTALGDILRNRLEEAGAAEAVFAQGHEIRARTALPAFYLRREYAPAWISGGGPAACATRFVEALREAPGDGLDGADYHLAVLDSLMGGGRPDPARLADLELLLTDAWLTFGSHLLHGRVNPNTLKAEWLANRRQADMASVLQVALATGNMEESLAALRPRQAGYHALRRLLNDLRFTAARGGWGTVPEGPTLHPGDTDPRVPALRRRLLAEGDLAGGDRPGDERFDDELTASVRSFQLRHGLEADGNVGRETLAALDVPVEERIAQVEVNLERWRWLPDDLGRRHIRVNIADYHMEVREDGHMVLEMRAVVGQAYRETPTFSAPMTYLVLSPYWHVPPGIAAADKLPAIKKDPGYLAAQHMTLFDQATNRPVDPATVAWETMTGATFNRRFRIRQDPGPWNALGQVKFMLPNPYSVYLHDTPSRELFGRSVRTFSSGCVRLEKPLALAGLLLAGDPAWTPERMRAVIAQGRETTVWLPEPVPVHILYWTAFADDDGTVQFRPDVYGRDAAVRRALRADPPGP